MRFSSNRRLGRSRPGAHWHRRDEKFAEILRIFAAFCVQENFGTIYRYSNTIRNQGMDVRWHWLGEWQGESDSSSMYRVIHPSGISPWRRSSRGALSILLSSLSSTCNHLVYPSSLPIPSIQMCNDPSRQDFTTYSQLGNPICSF